MTKPLWQPSQQAIADSQLTHFMAYVNQRFQQRINDYAELHQWSVTQPELFWEGVWSFCRVFASQQPKQIMLRGKSMQQTKWFIDAKLNFAQNLLRYRDEQPAIIFCSERGDNKTLSYTALFQQVSALQSHLKQLGIKAGDRVVGMLPNCPETVIAMLATTSLGAIWSACSSDFGIDGLLNRFSQIEPVLLLATDGHYYAGKTFFHLDKIKSLQQALSSLKQTIVLPFIEPQPDIKPLNQTVLWADCLSDQKTTIDFPQFAFDHPAYILYTSGTTGKPKCMVHGAGNTLLQHLKELVLHTDLRRSDRIFFYTTCSWMMWHWLISSLAVGATIVLYEGSPAHPKLTQLFDLIDKHQISVFGVGTKLLESAEKNQFKPKQTHQLTSLRSILTTGSPLLADSFDYVYQSIKQDVQLSSISGGSDIISCFALGNPNLPVYQSELQCLGLGMDVKLFNTNGKVVIEEKGELVCTSPFPSMPIYFWNDKDGKKYQHAYFDQFPNVWTHGDYALQTRHGGLIIYGRSDATLNPGGVRIGTAEIYQEVETFSEITDCLAVTQQTDQGEQIILFVTLKNNLTLENQLITDIKQKIRNKTSPLHVPKRIIQAPDLPKTLNGKTMELVVKKLLNHQPLDNLETLANPECLDFFKHFASTTS